MHFYLISLELGFQLEGKLLKRAFRARIGSHAGDGLFRDSWVAYESDSAPATSSHHTLGDRVHKIQHGVEVQVHVVTEGRDFR